ncbi:MAG TPA: HAMP domain-containing sensor histidine kinase [Aggregatilineales bacterium]|nr:HAMP domain-containing sensor histidine kinase [Aggregatilineales bacterium]
MTTNSPGKQLIQAGRKTRDALRIIRDIVRAERKRDIYNSTFSKLDAAVEDATDGLIEISDVFEIILRGTADGARKYDTVDVDNLHALQRSLASMKAEREELIENLQDAQQQLQKYADDLQTLYAKEREKRAELAVAYERLQEADRLKSDFLNTINHELSSPLVPIDLSLQIIAKGTLDAEQERSLSDTKKQLTHYKRQLDGLIKYASLVSQSHVVKPQPIDIQKMLDDTLPPLEMLARGRNIRFEMLPLPEDLNLVGDVDLISGALYQLVHNAIKFNKPGGMVDLKVYEEMQTIVFQIRDDGPGIPQQVMERFGQDFNQIVEAVKRGVEGLGLGLAFSHYVASTHDGQLIAHLGKDKGTAVQLRLPGSSDA